MVVGNPTLGAVEPNLTSRSPVLPYIDTVALPYEAKRDFLKRVFDVCFSAVVLVALSPLFLLIAALIKVISPNGPVIFGHERVGRSGEEFKCYKFRTMVPNAAQVLERLLDENPMMRREYQKDFKLKHDPRIIPGIGHFLRKTSLDELPQFFNVLMGNMSVIGPRPIVESEKEKYGQYVHYLLTVKPGISGLWQVSGRNDITYSERVLLDMYYIKKRNIAYDCGIVLKTVFVMLFRKGAY